MGKEIDFNSLGWTEGDDFIAFAFGDFISNKFGDDGQCVIYRISNSGRFDSELSPSMQDKVVDVPNGDGQYYFGTYHKAKVFNVNFVFDNLTNDGLRKLKQAFTGKEMRQLVFAEESNKVYMAKVTGQPTIKTMCFDETYTVTTGEGDEAVTTTHIREVYRGEGSVQFTAYWPYGRGVTYVDNTIESTIDKGKKIALAKNTITTIVSLSNIGDIPAHFVFEAPKEAKISKLVFGSGDSAVTIEGENITYWDSKTGIIKSEDKIIAYSGDGLYNIPINGVNLTITHISSDATHNVYFKYYNWYY